MENSLSLPSARGASDVAPARAGRRTVAVEVAGVPTVLFGGGFAFVPDHSLLLVSDLHLEKGAAFARRGMFLPPHDTDATLDRIAAALEETRPARVACLGDTFHDRQGASSMQPSSRARLASLVASAEWTWIAGNHDPVAPAGFAGDFVAERTFGALTLRHEPKPGAEPGEVSGHLHPKATVAVGGASAGGKCFACDGSRLVMPAFGEATGGLDVFHPAFDGLLDRDRAVAYILSRGAVYPVAFAALRRAGRPGFRTPRTRSRSRG